MEQGKQRRLKKGERQLRRKSRIEALGRAQSSRESSFIRMRDAVPATAGRLSEVQGTQRQKDAGRVAHYLWWIEDLDQPSQVVSRLIHMDLPNPNTERRNGLVIQSVGYTPSEVAWGCRWGVPWSATTLAPALTEGLSVRNFQIGRGRVGFGEILCLLALAGGSELWELLLSIHVSHGVTLSEAALTALALVPCAEEELAEALRILAKPTNDLRGSLIRAMLKEPLTMKTVADALQVVGSSNLIGINGEDGRKSSNTSQVDNQASAAGTTDWETLWLRAAIDREDGLERLQQAISVDSRNPSNAIIDYSQLRDALGAFAESVKNCTDGFQSFRRYGKQWKPSGDNFSGWTAATAVAMCYSCHRDAAQATTHLGDQDGAIKLLERGWEFARLSGEEELMGAAQLNLALGLIRRNSSQEGDLQRAEILMDDAESYYRRGHALSKLTNLNKCRTHLSDARSGRPVRISPLGISAVPQAPAHKGLLLPLNGRAPNRWDIEEP